MFCCRAKPSDSTASNFPGSECPFSISSLHPHKNQLNELVVSLDVDFVDDHSFDLIADAVLFPIRSRDVEPSVLHATEVEEDTVLSGRVGYYTIHLRANFYLLDWNSADVLPT